MPHPLLLAHPLFRGAREARIKPLLDSVDVRHIPKGSLLNTPGSEPRLMHLLVEGQLRSFQLAPDGRALLLELIEAGGFDGLLAIAGHRGHFTETVQDSLVAALPWEMLERLLEVEPSIAVNLVRLIAARLENREEHLESMALRGPSQRLARQLLALAETLGRREGKWVALKPRITHQMLADMLGVRRETVTVHLHRLVERGAVQARSGYLYLDRGALQRLVASPTRPPAAEG